MNNQTISYNICGYALNNSKCLVFKLKEKRRTLLKGSVVNPYGEPIPYAGIEIIQRCKLTQKEINLGVIFADENGLFGASIESYYHMEYLLNIYSSVSEV